MDIRVANMDDLPLIMQLVAEVVPVMNASGNFQWDDNYPGAAVFENDIALEQLWVAVMESNIAGIAAITTQQDAEYAGVGWDINELAIVTHRLAVSPAYQGRGVATKLLQQAENEAKKKGIIFLRIDTNSANLATQKLFPKLGYLFAGEISLNFRAGLRFYCYEKRLVPKIFQT